MKILLINRPIDNQNSSGVGIKLHNLLSCLSTLCNITCVYMVECGNANQPQPQPNSYVSNRYVTVRRHKNCFTRYTDHLKSIISVSTNTKQELGRIMKEVNPDLIWLEFGYICNLIPFLRKYDKPVVYVSHNSQFNLDLNIWRMNANLVYKIKMAPFLMLYFIHERLLFKKADQIFCISAKDLSYHKKFIPESKLGYLPYFFDGRHIPSVDPARIGKPFICMVGSLNAYQNFSAAIFAIEMIWPLIQEKQELLFYIIGELPPAHSAEYAALMRESSNVTNVVFTGVVSTVIPFVKGARVNIVPLLLGSGVRTKIIESVACKTPVVSTSIGAEGLPFKDGESICLADDAEVFAGKVLDMVNDNAKRRAIAEKAYCIYMNELSYEAGVRELSAILSIPQKSFQDNHLK